VWPAFQSHALVGFSPHVPHWQLLLQTCWPQHDVIVPAAFVLQRQSLVAPGAQPCPLQLPKSPHWHAVLHVRVFDPQLPQTAVSWSPG
jgi:hypothetical protein